MPIELTERQRRLIDAALILAVIALGFVVVTDLAGVFYAFGDVLLLFFLAWLLSFALLPLIRGVASVVPRMPQAGAVIIVYLAIVALLLAIVVQASASLATSIGQFIQDAPRFEEQLQNLLTQVEAQLTGARVPGGPRQPGADHRGEPPDVGARSSSGRCSRSRSRASACSATCCCS